MCYHNNTERRDKKMFKKMVISLIIIVMVISAVSASAGFYPMSTVVCQVDYEADTVVCSDFNENLWCFYGCEDWETGDICSMIMWDRNTENIEDDVILVTNYSGWIGW